jgi:hypothetical protein
MGLIERVAQIDKKFSWSFLGFVLAAIFGGIAIYTEFIRDTSPIIKYEVLSNTKILDVKEDVTGLSIIYNAEDIKKARKTLSVLIVRIGNEGRSPILKTYYDSTSPLGFTINSGEIIKAEVISATTDYLMQNAGISLRNPSSVEFSEIIIEPNESFTAKFLILHPEQSTLTISPKGKIAGVKKLLLADRLSDQTKETFLMKVIAGSLWVQIARVPVYLIAFIILMIIIIAPLAFISEKKDKIKKNRIIRQFKSHTNSMFDELNAKIYEFYKNYGLTILKRIRKTLADDKEFQIFIKKYTSLATEGEATAERDAFVSIAIGTSPHDRIIRANPVFILKSMLELGLISKVGESYIKNEEKIKAMNEFIHFAVTKKA